MNRVVKASVELAYKNSYNRQVLPFRRCTTGSTTTATTSSSTVKADVPGLSKNTVDVPATEVGFPSASKNGIYKNPEYFCYHNTSYFEAEVEMMKYRLPQPSNKKK